MSQESIKGRLRSTSKTDKQSEPKMADALIDPSAESVNTNGKENLEIGKGEEITTEKIWAAIQQLMSTVGEIKKDVLSAKGIETSIASFRSSQEALANRLDALENVFNKLSTKVSLMGNLLINQDERLEVVSDDIKATKRGK